MLRSAVSANSVFQLFWIFGFREDTKSPFEFGGRAGDFRFGLALLNGLKDRLDEGRVL